MKTTNEILNDIYAIVNTSFSTSNLTGAIYKKTRPTDSQLEDTIISLISGNNAKFVTDGAIYIKTFYKNLFINNTYYEDMERGQYIENLYIPLSETLVNTTGYFFDVQSREIYPEKVEEFEEYFIILKMNFKLTN